MATDIVDIVTNLSFKAETTGLSEAYKELNRLIKLIAKHGEELNKLNGIKAGLDKGELELLQQTNKAHQEKMQALQQELAAMKQLVASNASLNQSIASNLSILNRLIPKENEDAEATNKDTEAKKRNKEATDEAAAAKRKLIDEESRMAKASKDTTFAMTNLNYIVQDAPYGFVGLSNNITPLVQSFTQLQASTGGAGAAIKAMLGSLIGPQGLFFAVSIVSSFLITFGDRIFDSGKKAEEAANHLEEFNKGQKNVIESISKEILSLNELIYTAQNTNLSYKERLSAVDTLISKYPFYFKHLSREQILVSDLSDIYETLTDNILNAQIAREKFGVLEDTIRELAKAKLRLFEITHPDKNSFTYYTDDIVEDAENAVSNLENRVKAIQKSIKEDEPIPPEEAFWSDPKARAAYLAKKKSELEEALSGKDKMGRKQRVKSPLDDELSDYEKALLEFKKFNVKHKDDFIIDFEKELHERYSKIASLMGELKKSFDEAFAKEVTGVTLSDQDANSLNFLLERQQIIKENQKKNDADREKKRKEERKQIEGSAKEIQDNIFSIMQQGLEKQKTLLDLEVQIRSERVNQAVLLAQQGNAEILKSEQERLNQSQKEREKVARKQIELNNIMAASSAALTMAKSLETIATAGTGGDGYSAPIRILAAVAALSAGFGAVYGMVNSYSSFKDGVVNFKGKGTGTSDENMVFISNGESVITAAGTRKYAPILEAINKDKPLPIPMTNSLYPNSFSQKQNYNSLEKRLDKLIELQSKNDISVKTMVTNGQIANIVESERRFNRLQWS